MSFSNLKKQSSLGSLTAKLQKEVEKLNSSASNGGADERIWKPEVDKTGNGYAVIRFLPAPDGEDIPWAKMYNHAFQGTGGWLIDNCLTSVGGKCPICEANSLLWNSGIDANKEIARQRKRKLSYYANIYVVRDPANPQNEGKVFLYKFGKKIFDKIEAAMNPEFEDEEALNPFDFWQGADFKLKIKKVAGYWNYDSSEFARPSALLDGDDDALEALWKKEYSLAEITGSDQFKSYDQLKDRLNVVLGTGSSAPAKRDESFDDEDEDRGSSRELTDDLRSELTSLSSSKSSSVEDDDDLSYFQKLAEEF